MFFFWGIPKRKKTQGCSGHHIGYQFGFDFCFANIDRYCCRPGPGSSFHEASRTGCGSWMKLVRSWAIKSKQVCEQKTQNIRVRVPAPWKRISFVTTQMSLEKGNVWLVWHTFHHLRPKGGKLRFIMFIWAWKHDGILMGFGYAEYRLPRLGTWQDLSPWPSASNTASKRPGSLGWSSSDLRPAPPLAEARVTPASYR